MSFQPTDSAYKKYGVLQEQPQDMRGMFPIRKRVNDFLTSQGLTPEIPNQGPTVPSSMFFREAERHTPGINDNIIRLRNLLQSGQRLPQAASPSFGGQEVAMTEKEEDKMLLRSLQRGEMGSGKNIDKAIQDLINKINGVGVRGV